MSDDEFLNDRDCTPKSEVPRFDELMKVVEKLGVIDVALVFENLRACELELARAMKVVEAVEATMCVEFPEQLRNAMQRWWDEEAGR